jgi:hypothetical protein
MLNIVLIVDKLITIVKSAKFTNLILFFVIFGASILFVSIHSLINVKANEVLNYPYIREIETSATKQQNLIQLENITCVKDKKTIFAVDLPELNYNTLNFYSSSTKGFVGNSCNYQYLGFTTDEGAVLDLISNFDYVVSDLRLLDVNFEPQPYFTNSLSKTLFDYLYKNNDWKQIFVPNSTIIIFFKNN